MDEAQQSDGFQNDGLAIRSNRQRRRIVNPTLRPDHPRDDAGQRIRVGVVFCQITDVVDADLKLTVGREFLDQSARRGEIAPCDALRAKESTGGVRRQYTVERVAALKL